MFVDDSSSDHLRVEKGKGLTLTVKAGRANINGAFYWQKDDETITLTNSSSTKTYNIVLRLNDNDSYRNISVVASELITRTDSIYDLVLATVKVQGNSTEIKGSDITDTRLDSSRCGVVTNAIKQIDTTQFFNQFAEAIAEAKQEYAKAIQENQKAWDDWFAVVKDVLGEAVGGTESLYNVATASAYGNVSGVTLIQVPCGASYTITLGNNSGLDLSVQNANIIIKKLA